MKENQITKLKSLADQLTRMFMNHPGVGTFVYDSNNVIKVHVYKQLRQRK